MPATAPTIRPPEVLQRSGHCVRLAQLPVAWLAEYNLGPCSCGNRVFVVTAAGLVLCRACPRPKYAQGQAVIDYILMPARSKVPEFRKTGIEFLARKVHHAT